MLLARILVVLATLFAVRGLLAGYIRYQALDNETFSNSAAELIANDDRSAIRSRSRSSKRSTRTWTSRPRSRSAYPPDQKGLAGPIAAVARELADRAAIRVLERPRAQELWVRSLSTTHEQLLRVLNDDLTDDQQTEGGVVVLNLQAARDPARRPGRDLRPRRPATPGRRGPDRDHGRQSTLDGAGRDPVPEDPGAVPLDRAAAARRARDLARRAADGGRSSASSRSERSSPAHSSSSCAASPATTSSTTSSRPSPCGRPRARPGRSSPPSCATAAERSSGSGSCFCSACGSSAPATRATAVGRRLAPWLERPEIAYGAAALLLALLVWWGPTAQMRRWQLILAFAVMLGFGVAALARAARADEALPAPAPEPEAPPTA